MSQNLYVNLNNLTTSSEAKSGQTLHLYTKEGTESYVQSYVQNALKNTAAFTVQNGITGSSLVLTDHTDTRMTAAAMTALTVTLPETIPDTYAAAFSFVSGAAATTLTASGIKWQGADCNAAGVFIPAANTNYEVSVKCVGFDADNQPILVARVGVF